MPAVRFFRVREMSVSDFEAKAAVSVMALAVGTKLLQKLFLLMQPYQSQLVDLDIAGLVAVAEIPVCIRRLTQQKRLNK